MIYAWIALGGAIGSVARALASSLGPSPWATVGINAAGSFLIGALAAMGGRLGPEMRAFLMVGLCGGFTTFSAFSLQTVELLQEGRGGVALANVLASVALCLGATALGWQVGRG